MSAQIWGFRRRRLPEGITAFVVDDTGEFPIVVVDTDASADCIARIKTEREVGDGFPLMLWWLAGLQEAADTLRRAFSDGVGVPIATATTAAVVAVSAVGAVGLTLPTEPRRPALNLVVGDSDRPLLAHVAISPRPGRPYSRVSDNNVRPVAPTPAIRLFPSPSPSPSPSWSASASPSPTWSASPSASTSAAGPTPMRRRRRAQPTSPQPTATPVSGPPDAPASPTVEPSPSS